MLHVVIREGLVDESFVADHTTGFEAVAESVQAWTPERAAAVCGVPAADIVRAPQIYGRADQASVSQASGMETPEMGHHTANAAPHHFPATGTHTGRAPG